MAEAGSVLPMDHESGELFGLLPGLESLLVSIAEYRQALDQGKQLL